MALFLSSIPPFPTLLLRLTCLLPPHPPHLLSRCIHCGVVHLTLALLKSHIQERHCQVFHKCAFCPMAFKTASSTADHSATQHPTQPHRPSQ